MPTSSNSAQACDSGLLARSSRLIGRRGTLASLLLLSLAAPTDAAPLTGGAKLTTAYRSILSAQFDRTDAEIRQACPPAPAEACRVLDVVSLWWRIQLDPDNRAHDRLLNERAQASIAAAEAWTRRDPKNAEPWFYLAGSYAPLVQWQVLRGERVSAARNGNRVREALERALKLEPSLADAQFGIGVYEYYADVASATAKLFRWLLLLPGGDRVKGLRAIEETSRHGELMRDEAVFQLYQINIWYEHKPSDAIALLRSLDERYPTNPLFLQRIAETYDDYLHDARASVATWQMLIDRANHDRVYDAARIIALAEKKRRAIIARDPKLF
jgi:tetratricopeptide (TPR) repeat protein